MDWLFRKEPLDVSSVDMDYNQARLRTRLPLSGFFAPHTTQEYAAQQRACLRSVSGHHRQRYNSFVRKERL